MCSDFKREHFLLLKEFSGAPKGETGETRDYSCSLWKLNGELSRWERGHARTLWRAGQKWTQDQLMWLRTSKLHHLVRGMSGGQSTSGQLPGWVQGWHKPANTNINANMASGKGQGWGWWHQPLPFSLSTLSPGRWALPTTARRQQHQDSYPGPSDSGALLSLGLSQLSPPWQRSICGDERNWHLFGKPLGWNPLALTRIKSSGCMGPRRTGGFFR